MPVDVRYSTVVRTKGVLYRRLAVAAKVPDESLRMRRKITRVPVERMLRLTVSRLK
jgi:hypothetical protein